MAWRSPTCWLIGTRGRVEDLQNVATPVKLTIQQVNNAIELSWSAYPGLLKLQASPDLQSWTDISRTPTTAGDRKTIALPKESLSAFFRLR